MSSYSLVLSFLVFFACQQGQVVPAFGYKNDKPPQGRTHIGSAGNGNKHLAWCQESNRPMESEADALSYHAHVPQHLVMGPPPLKLSQYFAKGIIRTRNTKRYANKKQ